MLKKVLYAALCIIITGAFNNVLRAETTIGGHVKITLFDYEVGVHENESENLRKADDEYVGMGFREFILYFSSELNEKISVDLQPYWVARTGATPTFGNNIGDQRSDPEHQGFEFGGLVKGTIKYTAPFNTEVTYGIIKPRYTLDYGAELFWEDEFNGGKFTVNNYLGAMHDTGFEIYRNFEVGSISMPVYLYVLNGGNANEFSDNNSSPAGMIHIEPEMGSAKLLGSFYYGRYNSGDMEGKMATRWSGGASYSIGDLSIRGEYAQGIFEDGVTSTTTGFVEDAKPMGFYVKVGYRITDWMRIMFHYDYVESNFKEYFSTSGNGGYKETYNTYTGILQLFASESTILMTQVDVANWVQENTGENDVNNGKKDTLDFTRVVVGLRSTF